MPSRAAFLPRIPTMLFSSALLAALLVAGAIFDAMAEEHPDRQVCMRPVNVADATLPRDEWRE